MLEQNSEPQAKHQQPETVPSCSLQSPMRFQPCALYGRSIYTPSSGFLDALGCRPALTCSCGARKAPQYAAGSYARMYSWIGIYQSLGGALSGIRSLCISRTPTGTPSFSSPSTCCPQICKIVQATHADISAHTRLPCPMFQVQRGACDPIFTYH